MKKWAIIGGAIAYALVILLMTWPAPTLLSQQLIGNNEDNWIFFWNNWQLEQAISNGSSWYQSSSLFYPQGVSLITHSNSFLNSLLALPLKPLLGPVAAFNLVFLFGLWVGAVGMFLLVYHQTGRGAAGFVAGFVFAFSPYHLTRALAHMNLGSIHWWPFYALFLGRALQERRMRDAVWAGLFAALTLWSGLHLALLLALWTVAYLIWFFWQNRRPDGGGMGFYTWRLLGVTGVVALLFCAPLIWPLLPDWGELSDAAAAFDESAKNQTDLLAYWVPPTYHPVFGDRVNPIYQRFLANQAFMPYVGYAVLILAGLGLVSNWKKQARFWLLSGLVWMVLAAGPSVRWNGETFTQIPLPFRFIGDIFPISALRVPDRFNLLVVFSLASGAGFGVAFLWERRRWLTLLLASLMVFEFWCAPLPMWELPETSSLLDHLAQDSGDYALVDYPMGYSNSKFWLYFQTLHEKPIVEGHLSRYRPEQYAYIASQPLLQGFYQYGDRPRFLPAGYIGEVELPLEHLGPSLRSLTQDGVRFVLVHQNYLDPVLQQHLWQVLPGLPVYQDKVLALYDLTRPLPLFYDFVPVGLAPHVDLVRFDVQPNSDHDSWRIQLLAWMRESGDGPLACDLALAGEDARWTVDSFALFDPLPAGEGSWQLGDLDVKEIIVTLPAGMGSGAYRWGVECDGGASYWAPDTLQVTTDGAWQYLRVWANVRYGELFLLQGYQWRTEGIDLHLDLVWEVLGQPPADYKVFVHLLDAAGNLVRQYDAVPCNWGCPTGQWELGEVVLDQATLSLANLSPGAYQLSIGLYHAQTGERLPVQGSDGETDDHYPVPEPLVISPGQPAVGGELFLP